LQTVDFDREVSTGPQTLTNGTGDAFDHAVLLASTCRADGIPARIAIGFLYNQSTARPAMRLHAWVEFHNGSQWIPIDSSRPDTTVAADRVKWGEFALETINPYDAILSLGRQLSDLEISVLAGSQ
jgi:transglutaminase-like putative cysteine protease